jgi:hypothetical protein
VKVLRRTPIAILIVLVAALSIAWLIVPRRLILLAVLLNGFAGIGTPPGTLVVETRAGSSGVRTRTINPNRRCWPLAAPPTSMGVCFEERWMGACWPMISRPASGSGK